MRRKRSDNSKMPSLGLCIFLCALAIHGATAQRRRAIINHSTKLLLPAPSEESLKELAVAMGAAGYEPYATGTTKPIVKRLIPDNANPDLDGKDYQGVIGKPGVDFPVHPSIPTTNFNCKNIPTGYYADLETDCQVFHICDNGRKISFLCPNGTIFHQSHLICDWWFKVDCASSPASYEESAEHLYQDQKKRKQENKSLSHHKNSDLQNINADSSNINIQNGPHVNNGPSVNAPRVQPPPINIQRSATVTKFSFSGQENFNNEDKSRYRPSKHSDNVAPLNNIKATARSFETQAQNENNYNNGRQSSQETIISETEKRRKALIQNTNYRVPTTRSSFLHSYTDANVYRASSPAPVENNNYRESQVPAESSAFASGTNRQYFNQQTFNNFNTNFKPYPVYSPTPTTRTTRLQQQSTSPTFTSSYVPDLRNRDEYGRAVTAPSVKQNIAPHFVTKRPTLVPYVHPTTIARSYTEEKSGKHQPYTRPGVWQLKEHLEKERNKTLAETNAAAAINSETNDNPALRLDTDQSYEHNNEQYNDNVAPSTQYHSSYSEADTPFKQYTTEPTYYDRRDRLSKKLEQAEDVTEPTTEKFFGRRPGLVVPPSLTPNTLHSLAIYYATALDNLVTTTNNPEIEEITTTPVEPEHIAEENKEYLGALLSHNTIEKYSNLFRDNAELTNEYQPENNGTENDLGEDLSVSQSQGPLASSPQIRELAQVFTHALSAYLQDPEQFRKVLSEIRPTEPSFGEMAITTESSGVVDYINDDSAFETMTTIQDDGDDEILGFSDDNKSSRYGQIRESFAPSYPTNNNDSSITETVTQSASTAAVYHITDTTEETPKLNALSQTRGSYYSFCCGGNRQTSPKYQETSPTTESTVTPNYDERQGRLNRFRTNDNTFSVNGHSSYFPDENKNNSSVPRYGGFQNNSASSYPPYGQGVQPSGATPIAGNNYEIPDSVPTHWGTSETNTTVDLHLKVPSIDIEPPTNNEETDDLNNRFNPKTVGNGNEDFSQTTLYPTTTLESNRGNQQYDPHFAQTVDDDPEIENEEQLQRAHSQSFLSPQNSFDRHGKNTEEEPSGKYVENNEYNSKSNATFRVRTSAGDSIPVHTTRQYPDSTSDFTERPSTTVKNEEASTAISYTVPVEELSTVTYNAPVFNKESGNTFQWSNSFDNWHSTAVLDPITLNDGLSNDDQEQISSASTISHISNGHTTTGDQTLGPVYVQSTTPTSDPSQLDFYNTSDQQIISQQTNDAYTYGTPSTYAPPTISSRAKIVEEAYENYPTSSPRDGKALSGLGETSSELDTTNIENMMEKAKEVLGELNVTNSDSLVNVMKKTKSNTMRRLILLLVQTCDDDHNKTAEASKKALLEALMTLSRHENPTTATTETQTETVPQYTDDIEAQRTTNVLNRITNTHRRMDMEPEETPVSNHEPIEVTRQFDRRGKRLRFDSNAINAINALTDVTSTLVPITTTQTPEITETPTDFSKISDQTETSTTFAPPSSKPVAGRRGVRKFLVRTSPVDKVTATSTSAPKAEARVAGNQDITKIPSDTRALELLRSLYTIAARWG